MRWHAHATVERWDATGAQLATTEVPRNLVTAAGSQRVLELLTGAGGQALTATSTRIGVGDGTVVATATDTDLAAAAGAAHRWWQPLDTGWPVITGTTLELRATVGPSDALHPWREWGTDIGTPPVSAGTTVGPLLLQHRTGLDLGTKLSGQTWRLTVTVTLGAGAP